MKESNTQELTPSSHARNVDAGSFGLSKGSTEISTCLNGWDVQPIGNWCCMMKGCFVYEVVRISSRRDGIGFAEDVQVLFLKLFKFLSFILKKLEKKNLWLFMTQLKSD
ncbi:hypothetical protein IEQ34_013633 [Dendrobium chrysotoxum]|uniref:Uncharacterized protein n=1 Tax=Dendrobium chrysotoxum TaxID=161865 RepID=A0AAV7GRF3_DENCH|nr:hypothetical protein IEQ34_013633 [Dendrobium chrysotoxum]